MGRAWATSMLTSGALLAALCACTDTEEPSAVPSPDGPTTSTDAPPAPAPAWSLDDARVDRVPDDPPLVRSALPASFPPDDAALPDLLADPPGRARLAYHPRETYDDVGGWVSERVFFLGTDDVWRSLELVDLGLPESMHPGVDTYGAGELSPDGTRWAAKTNDGIVLVDLRTARSRTVALPGAATNYLDWRPDGRRLDVSRYRADTTHRTWTVDPRSLATVRATYDLPLDGHADDGSVHTFDRAADGSLEVIHRGPDAESRAVPIPYRLARLGGAVGPTRTLFGMTAGVLVVDNATSEPLARLRIGPRDGVAWPRGWLDEDTVYFYEDRRGLLSWDVVTGEVRRLVRPRPAARPDSYWSMSVADDLVG